MLSGSSLVTTQSGDTAELPAWHNALTNGINQFIQQAVPSQFRSQAYGVVDTLVDQYHDDLVAAIPNQVLHILSSRSGHHGSSSPTAPSESSSQELPAWHNALTNSISDFIENNVPSRFRPAAWEAVNQLVNEYHDDLVEAIPSEVFALLNTFAGGGHSSPQPTSTVSSGAVSPTSSEEPPELPAWHNALTGAIGGLIQALPQRYQPQASQLVGNFVEEYHDDLVAAIPTGFLDYLYGHDDDSSAANSSSTDGDSSEQPELPAWHNALTGGIAGVIQALPAPYRPVAMGLVDNFVENYHDDLVDLTQRLNPSSLDHVFSLLSDRRDRLSLFI